ncbi:MAG: Maf family nucleotide pyrophosphatase [Xanthomonadales bacterium]|nr:Maf family nucleotide pyrophosphatase [Xanthomonadales bacterium]
MRIILASTSIYRKQLLQRLFNDFECLAPAVDETPFAQESVSTMVDRLALAKAGIIADQHPEAVVIGSDQSLLADGKILGKAGNADAAAAQLQLLSGREVVFETAVALVSRNRDISLQRRVPTLVRFRHLNHTEIQRYIERESPFDCAGSFKAEALGISLFEWIKADDPTALIGLPLIATAELLRSAGCQIP